MILRRDVPEGASFFYWYTCNVRADIESAPAGIQYVKFKLFYNNVTIFERI